MSPTRSAAALVLMLAAGVSVSATERLERRFDQRDGLAAATVLDLAQDSAHFLWMGTAGGLVRYDGAQMLPWGRDRLPYPVNRVRAGPGGVVLALTEQGAIFRTTAHGVEPLQGPGGGVVTNANDAIVDARGRIWIAFSDALWRRDGAHTWVNVAPGAAAQENIRRLRRAAGDDLFVITRTAVWRLDPHGTLRREVDEWRVVDVVEHDAHISTLAWPRQGVVTQWTASASGPRTGTRRLAVHGRPIALAQRGGTTWASFDRFLGAIRSGTPPEILGASDLLPSSGPLLVDHEGSLWLGTFRGVIHYPEPETLAWNERDGLPTAHVRFLLRSADGIWTSTWSGLGQVVFGPDGWRVRIEGSPHQGELCADARGDWWTTERNRVVRRGRGAVTRVETKEGYASCARSRTGGMWLSGTALAHADIGGVPRVVHAPPAPPDTDRIGALVEDRDRMLWVVRGERICRAPADQLRAGGAVAWTCETVPGSMLITDLMEVAPGRLWATSSRVGVLARGAKGWTLLPGSRDLPSGHLYRLVPSRQAGIWVLGIGTIMRVVDRPDLPAGWEIVERLTAWHGVPGSGVSDLVEDADGTVWLASDAGVVRVASSARQTAFPRPVVHVVDVVADGRRVVPGASPSLAAGRNLLELQFAALSYRDRGRLRYEVRLGSHEPWRPLTSGQPTFRFVDLHSGRYTADVRASLDGRAWSTAPAQIAFEVRSAWYLRPWALAALAATIALTLFALHRARVRVLLRLEQQRAGIAMDLHDEMGSGLGSIGILAGLATADHVAESARRDMAREIAGPRPTSARASATSSGRCVPDRVRWKRSAATCPTARTGYSPPKRRQSSRSFRPTGRRRRSRSPCAATCC